MVQRGPGPHEGGAVLFRIFFTCSRKRFPSGVFVSDGLLVEMATTVERPFVRLLTLSRDVGHNTNRTFEPNLRQLLAKEVAYGWRHPFR